MAAVAVIGRDVFLHMYTLVGCGRCRSGDWPPPRISYICNRWLAAVAVIGRSVSHTYVYTSWLPSVRAAAARSRGDHWIRALQMNALPPNSQHVVLGQRLACLRPKNVGSEQNIALSILISYGAQ